MWQGGTWLVFVATEVTQLNHSRARQQYATRIREERGELGAGLVEDVHLAGLEVQVSHDANPELNSIPAQSVAS